MNSNRYDKLTDNRKKFTDGLYELQADITDNLDNAGLYECDKIADTTNALIDSFTEYNKALIELLEELHRVTGGVNVNEE